MKNLEEILHGTPARGLSIQEPYASLLATGRKHFETRSYPTNYRGWIVIHAGKKTYPGYQDDPALMSLCDGLELVSGAFIAVARLTDCIPMTDAFIASLSASERAAGFYSPGRYAWKIEDVTPIQQVPARGYLGLWKIQY